MTTMSEPISVGRGIFAPVSGGLGAMALSALGVVFGDIGTSPLYTLKTVLGVGGPDVYKPGLDLTVSVWMGGRV